MNEIESLVEMIMQLSPPVSLMLAINIAMSFAKRTPIIPNWLIPWLCVLIGMICYPLITDRSTVSFAMEYPVAAQVITGFLIGGTAVWTHQRFVSLVCRFGVKTGETEFISKAEVTKE